MQVGIQAADLAQHGAGLGSGGEVPDAVKCTVPGTAAILGCTALAANAARTSEAPAAPAKNDFIALMAGSLHVG